MCSVGSYEHKDDHGSVYVREKGELRFVNTAGIVPQHSRPKPSYKLFDKDFSVRLHIDRFPPTECRKRNDHFVFTYNGEGSLRYTAKSLLNISLLFIADNIEHVDSLIGFPEQMADRLFTAAEAKQKFVEPSTSARGLQVFSEAYGELVLKSLCLRERSLLLSERSEEIRVFWCLETLDLHGCRLGDSHDFFHHLTSEACSRLVKLFLGENCMSDEGLRRLTTPIRVMKRGLENLQHLDLSRNPLTEKGLGYLTCFQKLRELDISKTNVKLDSSLESFFMKKMSMVFSVSPLQTFTHSECKSEGWAEEVINQWEAKAAEVPEKTPKPRTNALQFYGREKFVQENIHTVWNDSQHEEQTRVIHFYKLDSRATFHHTHPDTHTSTHTDTHATSQHTHTSTHTDTHATSQHTHTSTHTDSHATSQSTHASTHTDTHASTHTDTHASTHTDTHASTHTDTHASTRSGKKRKFSMEQEELSRNPHPSVKRSASVFTLSAEDLELLNSY